MAGLQTTSAPFTEPELLDALARGVTVVLPSIRAARHLSRAFDRRQRLAGASVWDAAPALSWADWTRSLWSGLVANGSELRILLNAAQERTLWREIIEASTTAEHTLISPDALADMAHSAWSLAATHNALARLRSTATTSDSRTFAAWTDSFARLCANQQCLSSALVDDALREHVRIRALRLEIPVILAGFSELTPAQAALIDILRASGAELTEASLTPPPRDASALRAFTVAPSPREELLLAARWLRAFVEHHNSSPQPPRIAVLLPQPEEERAELESVFREVLAPELHAITADPSSPPWEFASGAPLLEQPLAADALDLVRWIHSPLPIERISALLRSPFFGQAADRLPAARFDAQILRRGSFLLPELTLSAFLDFARRKTFRPNRSAPAWLKAVNAILQRRLSPAATSSFADWAELIRALLKASSFPGERPPTLIEFEAARAWEKSLDLLATLDFRGRRVSLREAIHTLERLLQSARLSVSASSTPIQIMRPGDADASIFDAIVLLRATDDAWPEPHSMHPLLGWPLQQSLGLPGADAARDAARARAQAESLLARTTHALITAPAQDANGVLRLSPLLRHLGLNRAEPHALVSAPPSPDTVLTEPVPDNVPLPPLPSNILRGGATVLRLQATCGFRAFAELRLRSSELDVHDLGLDAGERGSLVHRALESFWDRTHSRAELASLASAERTQRLKEAIDQAFAALDPPAAGWSDAYLDLQRDRLRRVLDQWLEKELLRGPFTIRSREAGEPIDVGPLRLDVRPDRIDTVDDGIVLVDYKTGAHAESSAWLTDRPDDPQLPLYALLTQPGELKGMFFGRIRPGKDMGWNGLATDNSVLPTLKSRQIADLDSRITEWRGVLDTLAANFAEGRAEVSPKDFALNCTRCAQRLLCRLDPTTLIDDQLDDDPDDNPDDNPEELDG